MGQNIKPVQFARSAAFNQQIISIAEADRRFHMYAIGRTGVGKSTMLKNLIAQDVLAGRGVALIDPHGDLADSVLSFIPKKRKNDLVYINPADRDFPVGLNIFEHTPEEKRHLVAANILSIFKKSWADSWGPRMAYVLQNAILALLENRGMTLLSLVRMLGDEAFRERVVRKVHDPVVRHFWLTEFAAFPERMRPEVVSPIQNKIGAYAANSLLRNILGQTKNTINLGKVLNKQGILIANLSKGLLGEDAANLLGSLIVAKLQLAALERAELPERERKDFYLYVDEFHNFTTESFATILSEARKYRLDLVLANQYLGQLSENLRSAVLANVGTIVIFRVGPEDAGVLAKEFGSEWPQSNLVNLDPYEIYYKLMGGGKVTAEPKVAITLPPWTAPHDGDQKHVDDLIGASRRRYARDRKSVEKKIKQMFESS